MKTVIRLGLIFLLVFHLSAHASNNNPATVQYVDDAVQAGVQRLSYQGGTGISSAQIRGAYTAGTGIGISGSQISVNPVVEVGDSYQGGIVVYVDSSSEQALLRGFRQF